jgi:rhamnosyltransferase
VAAGAKAAEPRAICAVITAFHPDQRLFEVIAAARRACTWVIVVDNTPGGARSLACAAAWDGVSVIAPGLNAGLAAALNTGVRALPHDCDAVLFLDQDSVLPDGLVTQLAQRLADPGLWLVGPMPVEAGTGRRYDRFSRGEALVECDALITSGMLARRCALSGPAPFREDFFVEWVDNDFCLRVREQGGRIAMDRASVLPHTIGDGRVHRVFGREIRVLHYPAWRHYWMMRNAVVLGREHVKDAPVWVLRSALYMGRQLLTNALFDPQHARVLGAFARGLVDGLRGRADLGYLPDGASYAPVERARGAAS